MGLLAKITGRIFAILGAVLVINGVATGATIEVLHHFDGQNRGGDPYTGPLRLGADGALYGTTTAGGRWNFGTAFRLVPTEGSKWDYQVLHHFRKGFTQGITIGGDGKLYGSEINEVSGAISSIFELSPPSTGKLWSKKTLYSFEYWLFSDRQPAAPLAIDAAGNLYGVTTYGGDYGSVFQLTPNGTRSWTFNVIHEFSKSEGAYPDYSLFFDADGALYGSTGNGGAPSPRCSFLGCGTLFRLTPTADPANWNFTVLHVFAGGAAGDGDTQTLVIDAQKNVFGATRYGGRHGDGSVYKLQTTPQVKPIEIAFNFNFLKTASHPQGLVSGPAGRLVGRTCCEIFMLTPLPSGAWEHTKLMSFTSAASKYGTRPMSVVVDPSGAIFGTTREGGRYGWGTIFKIVP